MLEFFLWRNKFAVDFLFNQILQHVISSCMWEYLSPKILYEVVDKLCYYEGLQICRHYISSSEV
jgi:hypothetical protein